MARIWDFSVSFEPKIVANAMARFWSPGWIGRWPWIAMDQVWPGFFILAGPQGPKFELSWSFMIHVMATATYSYTVGPSQMPSMLFVEPRCIRLVLQVRSEMTGLIRKLAHWHWHWPPKKGFAHTAALPLWLPWWYPGSWTAGSVLAALGGSGRRDARLAAHWT